MSLNGHILSNMNDLIGNLALYGEELQSKLKLVGKVVPFCFWEFDDISQNIVFSPGSCDFIKKTIIIAIKDLNASIDKYVNPDDVIQVKAYFNNLEKSKTKNSIEFCILLPDHTKRYVRIVKCDFSENDNTKIIGILYDATKWKNREISLAERLNFGSTVMATIPNPIFYKDSNLVYKYCNDSFCKYLDREMDQIIDHNIFEIRSEELAKVIHQKDLQLMSSKGSLSYQLEITNKEGTVHHVVFNKAVVLGPDGTLKGIVGVINDITEQVEKEKEVKRLIKLKDAVLEINNSVMNIKNLGKLFDFILKKVLTSMDHADLGCILLLEDDDCFTIKASIGYLEEEVERFKLSIEDSIQWRITNGNIKETVVINDLEKHEDIIFLKNKAGLKIKSFISAPIIIDGKIYGLLNIDSSRNNVFDEADFAMMEYLRGQLVFAINQFKLYENITYLSEHDVNTGLYNRGHFEKLFSTVRNHALKNNEPFSVILFDLNGLKHVNDTYGHLAGDKLILHFATTLKTWIKDSDILARYGGDEFISLIFNSNISRLSDDLENLRLAFENNPIHYENIAIVCSFSYGIAEFPYHGTNYDKLIEVADKNMYLYKGYLKNKTM